MVPRCPNKPKTACPLAASAPQGDRASDERIMRKGDWSRRGNLRETRSIANGLYRFSWDGFDGDGALVPPGIYIIRYEVDSDAGGATPTGTIGVAY